MLQWRPIFMQEFLPFLRVSIGYYSNPARIAHFGCVIKLFSRRSCSLIAILKIELL